MTKIADDHILVENLHPHTIILKSADGDSLQLQPAPAKHAVPNKFLWQSEDKKLRIHK